MAIIEKINESQFIKAFHDYNRGDNFSYEALVELYNYYEDLSEDMGEDIEFDVIGICCEWNESTDQEILNSYNIDVEHCEDDEEIHEEIISYLNDHTLVIDMDDGALFIAF